MVVVADIHLGLTSDSTIVANGWPSKVYDTVLRLNEAVEYAAKKDEDKILFMAGDLFDSISPKPYIIEALFGVFQYALDRDVEIVILPGNHDCDVKWTSVVVAEKAHYENVRVIRKPGVDPHYPIIYYLPHMPKRDEDAFLALHSYATFFSRFPRNKRRILIGHAQAAGAKGASERELEAGNAIDLDLSRFPRFDLIILGHVHKEQKLIYGAHTVVYPGSVPMCDFGEVNEVQGFLHVKIAENVDYQFIPFKEGKQYKQIKLDLISKDSLDLSRERIKRAAQHKLLKIVVYAKDALQIEEKRIREAFDEFGRVVRFEYVIQSPNRVQVGSEEVVFAKLDHLTLLKKYIAGREDVSAEVKKEALQIGKEVLVECLNVSD